MRYENLIRRDWKVRRSEKKIKRLKDRGMRKGRDHEEDNKKCHEAIVRTNWKKWEGLQLY